MATKKCPKCGEENPAEAVMCWACYTPLAGGAAAVAGGGLVTPRGGAAAVAPAGAAALENEEKSPIDPKLFLVGGLLLGALVIGAFTTGIIKPGGNKPLEGLPGGPTPSEESMRGRGGSGSGDNSRFQPPVAPPAPPSPSGTSGGGTTGSPPPAAAFKTVVPPDPRYSNGTMAIMPTTPNMSLPQAGALAKHARNMFASGGRWTTMQVLVINNDGAATQFRKYQAKRKGAKLTPNEYRDLASQGFWPNVTAFYESKGDGGQVLSPSTNPNGWWSGSASR